MKTIEELYYEVLASEELKAGFTAAAKEKRLAEFMSAHGCEATEAEVVEFLKARQSADGACSDDELTSVSGGCNGGEAAMSIFYIGLACIGAALASATKDDVLPKDQWPDGRILCDN